MPLLLCFLFSNGFLLLQVDGLVTLDHNEVEKGRTTFAVSDSLESMLLELLLLQLQEIVSDVFVKLFTVLDSRYSRDVQLIRGLVLKASKFKCRVIW